MPLFSTVNLAPAFLTVPEIFNAPPLLIISIAPPALASFPETSIPPEPSLVTVVSPVFAKLTTSPATFTPPLSPYALITMLPFSLAIEPACVILSVFTKELNKSFADLTELNT